MRDVGADVGGVSQVVSVMYINVTENKGRRESPQPGASPKGWWRRERFEVEGAWVWRPLLPPRLGWHRWVGALMWAQHEETGMKVMQGDLLELGEAGVFDVRSRYSVSVL